MVIVDQFTKWTEAYGIPSQDAEITAKTFVEEFVTRFGTPLELHTDQGRNFESELFKNVCKLLDIAKTMTTPYDPSSNGLVERFNRTLLQMIRCYCDQGQKDWDCHLPYLTAAYRSTPHSTTGITPNRLMLGREVYRTEAIVYGVVKANKQSEDQQSYLEPLMKPWRKITISQGRH